MDQDSEDPPHTLELAPTYTNTLQNLALAKRVLNSNHKINADNNFHLKVHVSPGIFVIMVYFLIRMIQSMTSNYDRQSHKLTNIIELFA